MKRLWGMAGVLGFSLAWPAAAAVQEDDLAVVKRAVKQEPGTGGSARPVERDSKERSLARRTSKPEWLRLRVVEKGGRKKVSVNLPLALVRAMGDDFDLGVFCGRHRGHGPRRGERERDEICPSVRLSEVLAALDSGEDLVQIADEDTTVRVWVE